MEELKDRHSCRPFCAATKESSQILIAQPGEFHQAALEAGFELLMAVDGDVEAFHAAFFHIICGGCH